MMAAEGQDLSGLVFCDPDGSPVHPIEFARSFGRRARRAGLPPIRFHDLRHTYASLSLAAGIHPKVVSERPGHANITITLDIYSHVLPSLQQEAADRSRGIDSEVPRRGGWKPVTIPRASPGPPARLFSQLDLDPESLTIGGRLPGSASRVRCQPWAAAE